MNIVLVDDEAVLLDVHYEIFTLLGNSVQKFINPKDALQFIIHDGHTELLVTDYMMPEMDGLELCKQVLGADINIPMIILTGYSDKQKLQFAKKLGAIVLNKPVNFERIELEMQKICSARISPGFKNLLPDDGYCKKKR